jgi:hypothetical protein
MTKTIEIPGEVENSYADTPTAQAVRAKEREEMRQRIKVMFKSYGLAAAVFVVGVTATAVWTRHALRTMEQKYAPQSQVQSVSGVSPRK